MRKKQCNRNQIEEQGRSKQHMWMVKSNDKFDDDTAYA